MINLDKTDKEILSCLEEDGRVSYSTIAKRVNLTSTAVSQRIQKMIEEELILGFSVILNKEKLNINIQAIITVKLNFTKINAFYKVLKKYPEIENAYRVTGEDCIIMKVNLRDNKHLLEFINKISSYGISKSNIIIDQLV